MKEKKLITKSNAKFDLKKLLIDAGIPEADLPFVSLKSLSPEFICAVWSRINDKTKTDLIYSDSEFNIELIEKLNLTGKQLADAFLAKNANSLFHLEHAPVASSLYASSGLALKEELLSVCRLKPELLCSFLNAFEFEFHSLLISHEIHSYYLNYQNHVNLEEEEPLDCEADAFGWQEDKEVIEPELQEFVHAFTRGHNIGAHLEFTHYLQMKAPDLFESVRNHMIFLASERGVPVWERQQGNRGVKYSASENEKYLSISEPNAELLDLPGLAGKDHDQELRRLVAIYTDESPLRKNYQRLPLNDFPLQGQILARFILAAKKNSRRIETFAGLRNAAWDAVGYTRLNAWLNSQADKDDLVRSSGKKWLIDDMTLLGNTVFGKEGIYRENMDFACSQVNKLFGWLSLVKILCSLSRERKSLLMLATERNGTLFYEENKACSTLIIQLSIGTDKVNFTLADLHHFCLVAKQKKWQKEITNSIELITVELNAQEATPIFNRYIEMLSKKSASIFYLTEDLHLSTVKEREFAKAVRMYSDSKTFLASPESIPEIMNQLRLAHGGLATQYEKQVVSFLSNSYDAAWIDVSITDLSATLLKELGFLKN